MNDGAGVRESFLVLSFSTTSYQNPNLFCMAPLFLGQEPEPITLLLPQEPPQLPDPSPMDHPRTLQGLASISNIHNFKNHSDQKGISIYFAHRKIFWKSDMTLFFEKS